MMRKLGKLLLVSFTAIGGRAYAQRAHDSLPVTGEFDAARRPFDDATIEILEMTEAPGAALAVAHDGGLVLARGCGYADRVTREPVEPDSRFRIARVSKPEVGPMVAYRLGHPHARRAGLALVLLGIGCTPAPCDCLPNTSSLVFYGQVLTAVGQPLDGRISP